MHTTDYSIIQSQSIARTFMNRVYFWMSSALALTAIVSYMVVSSPALLKLILGNPLIFFGLIIGEFILVGSLIVRVGKMQASTATGIFFGYAALNGLTLSMIFVAYTSESISSTFFITAGMFAVTSVYGYVTKKDLTSFGGFLIMGLFGIIIASIVNIFMKSTMLYWMITYIGVFVFVGLTAYDTQKIKNMAAIGTESEQGKKAAILGALSLYLDFINLFLMLLRIFGRRR